MVFFRRIQMIYPMRLAIFFLAVEDYMLPCFSKQLFDVDCPGCGIQRSIAFLIRGEFVESFLMYPAIITLIPLAIFLTANSFFKIKNANIIINTLMISTVVLILGNFLLKLFN